MTKRAGGTVEVTSAASPILGAKIEIPADPYPTRPDDFAPATARPVNDPADTNDCMWEDTEISIGYRESAPEMKDAEPSGPAVHVGPYRTFFNRNVSITIPYTGAGNTQDLMVYIYNHVLEDWDPIEPESVDRAKKLVTFKTKVLGLFQAGRAGLCPAELKRLPHCESRPVHLWLGVIQLSQQRPHYFLKMSTWCRVVSNVRYTSSNSKSNRFFAALPSASTFL